jgi:hypothetical protein
VWANGAVDELVAQTDGVASDVRSTAPYVWKSGSSIYLLMNLRMVVRLIKIDVGSKHTSTVIPDQGT